MKGEAGRTERNRERGNHNQNMLFEKKNLFLSQRGKYKAQKKRGPEWCD